MHMHRSCSALYPQTELVQHLLYDLTVAMWLQTPADGLETLVTLAGE